ncbi:hypothetical protein L1987_61938 [Smallanthus sonchifolius]|uniref:Uncharacterized protein n=1 Tax=Smallanthus sonchifolius TaxID=185202 RepID=A0ACB9C919_9ASTR|nr:hypothetical protein L1987_61938 [Smallanthus sonchifolius]
MSEVKDPAIKLFGKTIQLSHLDDVVLSKAVERQQYCSGEIKKTTENECVDDTSSDQSTSVGINDDPKTPTPDKEVPSKNAQKNSNADEKPQKPDKILPCPRCNSMDTKFCYYNNYNVNQPRHFCKNCQRYWTAGGTMRNTPVGSGRRKNKSLSSASYYRHLIITDTCLKNNGSVLNFGSESSDVRLCESMNQALNFSDKFKNPEEESSSSVSNLVENGGNNGLTNLPKYPVQIPCFPSSPWCYNPGFPVNFYPPPHYWGCTVQVQQSPWSMPLMNPNSPLGKHSRDGNEELLKGKDSGSLRINDPNKAAKSSLWSSLGVSKDENDGKSINGGVLSKAFQSKINENNEVVGSSLANLQANPAALSRSLNFRETS